MESAHRLVLAAALHRLEARLLLHRRLSIRTGTRRVDR